MKFKPFFLGAALMVAPFSAAFDLGLANQFNAFVFNNANTAGGHSDGAVAVRNNWTGSGYDSLQHNNPATVGADNKIGMYVGGSVSFTNGGSINNSGNGRVKGNFTTQNPFNMNGGSLYVGGTKSGPVNGSWFSGSDTVNLNVFSTQQTFSQNQSAAIMALGGEAINTANPNNWNINAALQSGPQKIYQIATSNVSLLRTLDINGLAAGDTVMINVTGASASGFGLTVNTNTGIYNKILWNFGGTSFDVKDRALHGSLLAPNATVDQRQNIDGTLIALNWNNHNSQELHYGGFTGNAVPEPASMVALGLGVAAILRRRKKQS